MKIEEAIINLKTAVAEELGPNSKLVKIGLNYEAYDGFILYINQNRFLSPSRINGDSRFAGVEIVATKDSGF